MKLSSSEAMISQFMTSMQNGTLKLDDLLSPSKSHPEVSHVIDILKKKGVDMSLLLSEAEQVYDHKNGPFNRQSFLSFLYHNPVGQKLKPTIISLMRTANDPQRFEYSFNRNDPKHPIVM